MKKHPILSAAALLLGLAACTPTPHDVQTVSDPLILYPDYQEVTIPCNMAPLNFLVRNAGAEALQLEVEGLCVKGRDGAIVWDEAEWHQLLAHHAGDTLTATLTACIEGKWQRFAPFHWVIAPDSIDPYITYRLIEPGYEVWHEVEIEERCLESFQTRTLADGKRLGNRCMNCHTHGGPRGEYSYFYIRGEKGATILQRNGRLRKVDLRTPRANGGSVYGDWHPSGRYAVYSTNQIIPAFHSDPSRRLEVYDTRSDLMVADFDRDTLLTRPDLSQSKEMLETFPAFSADGRWIYYCAARNPLGDSVATASALLPSIDTLHYALYRLPFEACDGSMGSPECLLSGESSISFPKSSPCGRYLAYTTSRSGTFPIWHSEARLVVADTLGQPFDSTSIQATYHTWSHLGHWLAFASKAADTQYGRVHFVHVETNAEGRPHLSKPFILPQANPHADDWNLRSFNIPDLSTIAMPYSTREIESLMEQTFTTPFK